MGNNTAYIPIVLVGVDGSLSPFAVCVQAVIKKTIDLKIYISKQLNFRISSS